MSDDFRVKSRRNDEVHRLAKGARQFFGVANERHVDILSCLQQSSIWTVLGPRRLKYEVLPDAEMGSNYGLTTFVGDTVLIQVRKSVDGQAFFGEGRARNTLSHELGHGVLGHDKAPMARGLLGNTTRKWLAPFESAEHQVKVFAPAFLINDDFARTMQCAEEISAAFGISLESARIYFEKIREERDRAKNSELIASKAREFRESVFAPPSQTVSFIQDLCTLCQQPKLFPVGNKYMCQNCNAVFDRFQDGDSVDG